MTAYFYLVAPIAFYLTMFSYETYAACWRVVKPKRSSQNYLHATWEVTHTFLILAINILLFLFSSVAVLVGKAILPALLLFGGIFIIRALVYMYIFYIRDKKTISNKPADWLFALCHILLLACVITAVVQASYVLTNNDYTVNTAFLPYMWPGLVLLVCLAAIPIVQLYRTKN